MCGRAAQTLHAAKLGAEMVGAPLVGLDDRRGGSPENASPIKDAESSDHEQRDNYNMSPGMDAAVIWKDDGELKTGRKVWGLVTKGGTPKNPLPEDDKKRMSLHFQNLQYNARVDTLYSKPTFSRLAGQAKTCLVPVNGYFEWKTSPLGGEKGRKQPYFVFRSGADSTCLLMAGLWTQVSTGLPEIPTLETFTILTTESNEVRV
jgi:putative SOS response-associated peptidase YedK